MEPSGTKTQLGQSSGNPERLSATEGRVKEVKEDCLKNLRLSLVAYGIVNAKAVPKTEMNDVASMYTNLLSLSNTASVRRVRMAGNQ